MRNSPSPGRAPPTAEPSSTRPTPSSAITLKTVPRRKDQDGFAVLAKRWRVERAISWLMRARRNVRDYERLISHSEAHITWTFITLMVRRLTRPPRPPRTSPHPVEPVKAAVKPSPIRIRKQTQMIRLAPHLALIPDIEGRRHWRHPSRC
ncbi:transposase [Streptomyces tibetensis]|uniref:transposase n=1 Tax=Streptomyces tibetensis TaxID=2382123 RepID=UPI0033FA7812